jgi:ATP-dependent Zn protease
MANIRSIAYHESGHTVIALTQGCLVQAVAITPHAGEQLLGGAWVVFSKDKIRAATQRTMVTLGGSIAQHAACPGSARGDDVDMQIALDAAAYIASDPRRFIEMMQLRTRKLIDKHWRAVEAVAAALLDAGKLTGDEIDALFARPRRLPLAAK